MDPEFTEFLAAMPPLQFADPAAQRELSAKARAEWPEVPWPDGVARTDHTVAAAHPVPVRRYVPDGAGDAAPVVLWIHGGGYCIGHPDEDEPFCARLAADTGAVVVSVDYRLAPEHPYPAALDDCYAALLDFASGAPLVVAGMSAGAGLAAALALRARDTGGPVINGQVLLCPFLDATMGAESMAGLSAAPVFNAEDARLCWGHYLGPLVGAPPVWGSPSVAQDLRGLPPAYVLAAGADCLRDEAVQYALRLQAAGVAAELHVVPGVPHAFTAMQPGASVSRRIRAELLAVLGRFLEPAPVQTP
ncbi:alpha/beta hydrolase [Amycolatopsis thermoflava]|uniref:alpha/beta hydrolase n=1 Tax=Amycolatopsis thermoflava TaxID=84480 RepID=UPI0004257443|nr:alpha/beta hydrolase [Amycolatopsis thermoflava]